MSESHQDYRPEYPMLRNLFMGAIIVVTVIMVVAILTDKPSASASTSTKAQPKLSESVQVFQANAEGFVSSPGLYAVSVGMDRLLIEVVPTAKSFAVRCMDQCRSGVMFFGKTTNQGDKTNTVKSLDGPDWHHIPADYVGDDIYTATVWVTRGKEKISCLLAASTHTKSAGFSVGCGTS